MPVSPTYPGVYVEELPSGVRTIVGVSTSVTAFVGRFLRGPSDAPVRVLSFGDFVRVFGGLWRQSPTSYAVNEFFLNGGTEAIIVRVGQDGSPAAPFAAATVNLRDGLAPGGAEIVRVRAGRRVLGETVLDPGAWGNLVRLEVDYQLADPTATTSFNLTVHELAASGGRLQIRATETFRNLTLAADDPHSAQEVVNSGSRLVQLDNATVALPVPLTRPAATGTLSAALPLPATLPGSIPADGAPLTVELNTAAVGPAVAVSHDSTNPQDWTAYRPLLEAAIRRAAPDDPKIAGARVELVRIGTDWHYRILTGRGGSSFDPDDVLTFSNTVGAGLGLSAVANVQMYSLGNGGPGGQSGAVPGGDGVAVTETALSGSQATKTGLYALEDADIFNLLAIPGAVDLDPDGMRALYTKAIDYCRERRAFLLVDIPETVRSVDAIQAWAVDNAGLRSDHSAVFYPRPRIPDPLEENRLKSRAASGTVAGLMARIDGDRGVWKAPAGTEARLRNVPELDYLLTDGQNGLLNPLGINCLRNFPVTGNVAWGARTLDGADVLASQWKYIPVRRLALYLEESLYRGLQWAVFEPNDEPLWAQIRLNVGAFMHNLFRKGAFQGSTPQEAYLVKCDAETTPQADIDLGIVNVLVGFAPLKPAEFVILKIQQLAGQQPA